MNHKIDREFVKRYLLNKFKPGLWQLFRDSGDTTILNYKGVSGKQIEIHLTNTFFSVFENDSLNRRYFGGINLKKIPIFEMTRVPYSALTLDQNSYLIFREGSHDWVRDIHQMHAKFGVHDWIAKNKDDSVKLNKLAEFRVNFIEEELEETKKALKDDNMSEFVDGIIDLIVVGIGTLDMFNVNAHEAWRRVHSANMTKKPGVKKSRPNPLGLPDLIKPSDFLSPEHEDNLGLLPVVSLDSVKLSEKILETPKKTKS